MDRRRSLLCGAASRLRHRAGMGTLRHLCADWHSHHGLFATRQQIARLDADGAGEPCPGTLPRVLRVLLAVRHDCAFQ